VALQNWKTQIRKGLLDLCVLNFLAAREYYGYDLVQDLKSIDGLQMREGNVYPILGRLEEEGLVTSEVRPSDSGPPRRYFRVTSAGRKAVEAMNEHWDQMGRAVGLARAVRLGGGK
jgi:PadR family transcriptional regulator PadR